MAAQLMTGKRGALLSWSGNELEEKTKAEGTAVRLWRHARVPGFRIAGARILARGAEARRARARACGIRGARGYRSTSYESGKRPGHRSRVRAFLSRLDDGGRSSRRRVSGERDQVWRDPSRGHAVARRAAWDH